MFLLSEMSTDCGVRIADRSYEVKDAIGVKSLAGCELRSLMKATLLERVIHVDHHSGEGQSVGLGLDGAQGVSAVPSRFVLSTAQALSAGASMGSR